MTVYQSDRASECTSSSRVHFGRDNCRCCCVVSRHVASLLGQHAHCSQPSAAQTSSHIGCTLIHHMRAGCHVPVQAHSGVQLLSLHIPEGCAKLCAVLPASQPQQQQIHQGSVLYMLVQVAPCDMSRKGERGPAADYSQCSSCTYIGGRLHAVSCHVPNCSAV